MNLSGTVTILCLCPSGSITVSIPLGSLFGLCILWSPDSAGCLALFHPLPLFLLSLLSDSSLTDLAVYCYSFNTPSWLRTFTLAVPSERKALLSDHPKFDALLYSDFTANALPSWETSLTPISESNFLSNPSDSRIILIIAFHSSSHIVRHSPFIFAFSRHLSPSERKLHDSCTPGH